MSPSYLCPIDQIIGGCWKLDSVACYVKNVEEQKKVIAPQYGVLLYQYLSFAICNFGVFAIHYFFDYFVYFIRVVDSFIFSKIQVSASLPPAYAKVTDNAKQYCATYIYDFRSADCCIYKENHL